LVVLLPLRRAQEGPWTRVQAIVNLAGEKVVFIYYSILR
jgi:hypothetical protein